MLVPEFLQVRGPFLESPQTFRMSQFPFIFSQRPRSKQSNLAVALVFLTLKTW